MGVRRAELIIERLSQLGQGAGRLDGRTVFVQGAAPGDRVRVELEPDGKVLRGRLLEVVEPSGARRAPPCPLADRCGGCDWMHLEETEQRAQKSQIVLSALEHNDAIGPGQVRVLPALSSPSPLSYRRRADLRWSKGRLGYFGHASHAHVPVDRCVALVPPLEELPGRMAPLLEPFAKDLQAVQLLAQGKAVAASLELRGPVRPKHLPAAERLMRELGLAGVVITPKEGRPELVGRPVLTGPAPLRPEVPLYFRPDAFAQANGAAAEPLVRAALDALQARQTDRALELYAGNGLFTFALAAAAGSVTAVEGAGLSVGLAQRSAREANVSNVRFLQGDATKLVDGLVRERQVYELLLADPPRTGAPCLGAWAKALQARRVVYVACDVGSLARDAKGLLEHGYRPDTLRLVEMFPQTHHIEAVMSFERSS